MRVEELLSREHAVFRRLLDRLDSERRMEEPHARVAMTEAFRILLPALDRHEEIEDMVFPPPADDAEEDALAVVAGQHRAIAALRDEVLYALELAEDCPFERLSALVGFLSRNLREHLATEETRLWPRYRAVLGRPLSTNLDRRVRALEREVERGIAALAKPL